MQKRTSTDRKSSSPSCVSTLLSHLAVGIISFQLGSVSHFAHNSTISPDHGNLNDMLSSTFQGGDRNGPGSVGECCKCPSDAEQEERLRQLNGNNNNNNKDGEVQTDDEDVGSSSSTANIFDNATVDTSLTASMNKMFVGAARVSRDSFITNFDLGVPWDMHHYYEDILLLYSDIDAFPTTTRTMTKTTTTQSDGKQEFPNVYYKSATDATQQCDTLKVILIDKEIGQCLALVPQWESYIVYKYLRYKDEKYKFMRKLPTISKTYPLRHVSRFHSEKKGGSDRDARIPTMSQLKRYLPMLSDYINNLDNVLDTLRPLLEEMMIRYKKINGLDLTDNHIGRKRRRRVKDHYAVVVMVCNYGQSELFLNFICTAKSRGLDISRILLFATDMEMYDLARTIPDISVFQVGDAFGVIPKTAARVYGDKVFTGMMFSKIYCVHLVNLLGYDVLFQDVDIVWYKNPVEYFENSARSGNYDFYFQDDGARSNRYAPYSPNSGFYYVRYNPRTLYFFSVFMRMGDSVIVMASHQAVLNTLLVEQSSTKGLRIKVFERDSKLGLEYPGGFQFHYRRHWMKSFVKGDHSPTLFHMSWTKNKDNKIKFFQQMGDWFLEDQCISKLADDIDGIDTDFYGTCCAADMLFQCHYSDKPSKKSCKGTGTIDRVGRAFW